MKALRLTLALVVASLVAISLATPSLRAQTPRALAKHCPEQLGHILARAPGALSPELGQFLTFAGERDCMTALLLTQYDGKDSLTDRAAQIKTALQQNASSPGSGSSTSLVSKGMTSQILAAAAESGSLAETVSGQTVTLSGSLGGIPAALLRQSVFDNCDGIRIPGALCASNRAVTRLNRLSYTVAFNTGSTAQSVTGTATASTTGTTGTTAQPVTFNASTNTVSSVTGKFVVLRGAASSITDTAAAIDKLGTKALSTSQLTPQLKLILIGMEKYDTLPAVIAWRKQTAAKIIAAPAGDASTVWLQQAGSLINAICPPNGPDPKCRATLLSQLGAYAVFVNGYKTSVNAFVESLRKAPLITLEYDYNRPASQPTNSTIRLVGQTVLGGWTLTGNGAISLYDSTPSTAIPGASLLRDAQFAGELSFDFSKLKKSSVLGHSTASTAYYFQDQTSPAILNVTPGQPASGVTITGLPATATQVYGTKGIINIVQGKFTFSPGTSSISIPLAFTWSNRTELVTGSVVRGQIGISYDFDSLFSVLK